MPAVRHDDELTGHRHYPFPPTGELFASTTTVISATDDSSYFIGPWKRDLAARYVLDNADRLTAMDRTDAMKDIAAAVEAIADVKSDAGSHVHAVTEAIVLWGASPGDTGSDITIPELPEHLVGALYDGEPIQDVIDAMVAGFVNFVADFKPRFTATEMTVFDPALKIAGTLDFRMEVDDLNVAPDGHTVAEQGHILTATVDTKSGKHMSHGWKLQTETYRRMPLALMPNGELVPLEPTQVSAVLHLRPGYRRGYRLMIVPPAEAPAAWNAFRHAMHVFHDRENGTKRPGPAARPLLTDGTLAPIYLADLDGLVHGRVLNPLVAALGTDVTVHDLAGFSTTDLLSIKGIGKAAVATIASLVALHGATTLGQVA